MFVGPNVGYTCGGVWWCLVVVGWLGWRVSDCWCGQARRRPKSTEG